LFTYISGQPIALAFGGQAVQDGTDLLSPGVGNQLQDYVV